MKTRFRNTAAGVFAALATLLAFAAAQAQERAAPIPILVYHRFGPTVADSMTVTTSTFDAQLAWLRDHHYRIVPLRTLIDGLRGRGPQVEPPAVVITADDGHRSVYEEMYPRLLREHIPVTLFIYPSAISNASYALTWEQLAEMKKSGVVEVQSHTFWHPNFNHEKARLSPEQYRQFVDMQLERSKSRLSERLGGTVDMLAWPFGIYNAELEQAAQRAGYIAGFTLERRPARPGDDIMALPRYLMTDADKGARFAAIVNPSKEAKP